jgi:hypothetical protein
MSSEKFDRVPGEKTDVTTGDAPMTEAEMAEAEAMYKVGGGNSNATKAAFGAMVLGAAMAAAPEDASAQSRERMVDSANISVESNRRAVREGVASHPELGELKIQVFYKEIDRNNPVIGSNYDVVVNGVAQKVASAQFIRSGAGFVEINNPDGTKGKLSYPSITEASRGAVPTFTAKEGEVPVPIK